MQPLPPIPVPPGHRWREFRVKALPLLVFLAVTAMVVVTWHQHLGAPTVVGEVENLSVNVISTVPGRLAELSVTRFQEVAKDQVLGRLYPTEPEQIQASLLAVQMDLKVMRARMALDEQRNALNYEDLQVDYLSTRADLAMAHAKLRQADSQRQRTTTLHQEKVVSDMELEQAVRDQEALQAEVVETARKLAALEQSLERLQPTRPDEDAQSPAAMVRAALEAHEHQLLLLEGPVSLRSPVSGVISLVHHFPGENILAGEPIVTLSPRPAERIIGYMRQPLRLVPQTGDRVRVRTRGPTRQVGEAQVVQVGSDMQLLTPSLHPRGFTANLEERGLPFLVSIPEGMQVYPGELVEVIFLR